MTDWCTHFTAKRRLSKVKHQNAILQIVLETQDLSNKVIQPFLCTNALLCLLLIWDIELLLVSEQSQWHLHDSLFLQPTQPIPTQKPSKPVTTKCSCAPGRLLLRSFIDHLTIKEGGKGRLCAHSYFVFPHRLPTFPAPPPPPALPPPYPHTAKQPEAWGFSAWISRRDKMQGLFPWGPQSPPLWAQLRVRLSPAFWQQESVCLHAEVR